MTDNIRTLLQERKANLQQLDKKVTKQLKNAPEGSLRVSNSHGRIQCYRKDKTTNRAGTYIPKSNRDLAVDLAQKDYLEKLRISIHQEMEAIDAYLCELPELTAEEVFTGLSEARQNLAIPLFETDDHFVRRWQEQAYTKKEIDD